MSAFQYRKSSKSGDVTSLRPEVTSFMPDDDADDADEVEPDFFFGEMRCAGLGGGVGFFAFCWLVDRDETVVSAVAARYIRIYIRIK